MPIDILHTLCEKRYFICCTPFICIVFLHPSIYTLSFIDLKLLSTKYQKLTKNVLMKKIFILLILLVGYLSNTIGQYNIGGSTIQTGPDCYKLTPEEQYKTGVLWFQNKISLASDLVVEATINLGSIDNLGADGIAFVLQPVCTGIGSFGGGLGYGGISPSLAVEFDTWTNISDPIYNHVGLMKNGNTVHSDESLTAISELQKYKVVTTTLEDGLDHTLRIQWTASTKTLTVTLDGNLEVDYSDDIVTNIFNGNRNVYWGFTGATGENFNNQSVCIMSTSFKEEGSYSVTNATCPTFNDGAIDLHPAGGIGPFTYQWSTAANSNFATTEDISGLTADKYYVTVTDGNGCESKFVIEVSGDPDVTAPTLNNVPGDATVECDAVPSGQGAVRVSDNCSANFNYYVTPTIKTKLVHHLEGRWNF